MVETLTQWALATWHAQLANVNYGYAHAPMLMLALSALLLAPVLALAGSLIRVAAHTVQPRPAPSAARDSAGAPPASYVGRLQLVTAETDQRIEIRAKPIRIGRQKDNDLRLRETTVHGYHAVVERARDGQVTITDISGPGGNGMRVNGRPCLNAGLAPGDIVELGAAHLEATVPTWARLSEQHDQLEHA